jgi:hypothetical protein
MRREEIINSVERILYDIKNSEVDSLLLKIIDHYRTEKKDNNVNVMIPFQKYSVATAAYGSEERLILDIMGIRELVNPMFWQSLVENVRIDEIYYMHNKVRSATEFLPRFLSLLERRGDYLVRGDQGERVDAFRGKSVVTAILAENEDENSGPERLVWCIQSVADFYGIFSEISGVRSDDLIVISCDSGSDKSFDFLGLAQTISAVKDFILNIWDRIVFYRHAQSIATIEVITAGLPVLAQLKQMEESGAIAPEVAEKLRRKTVSACSKFIEAGVIIPEMENEGRYSPRALERFPQLLNREGFQRL